jgi:trigger factor
VKSTVEAKSKTQQLVKVEIPSEIVSKKLSELFRRAAREIAMPGFRPGHAPRSVLESRFGKDFLNDDAKQELIQEFLPKALSEHKLRPVSSPQATDVGEFSEGQAFHFEAEIEILPELEVKNYTGLELEEPSKREPSQQEIEAVLNRMRTEYSTAVPKETGEKVIAEDIVTVHTENSKESQDLQVQAAGVTTAYLGKGAGDWVELSFNDGKKVKTKIELIKKLEKPDDEELASTLGHDEPKQMIEKIRAELAERLARQHKRDLRMALLDKIVGQTTVEIPPRMLDEVVASELEYLRRSGYPEPNAEEVKKLKENTEKRLKREMVVAAIKKQENLQLSDADFEALLKSEADERQMNPIKLKAILEREGRLQSYRADHEDEKVVDFLMEKAKINPAQ